MGTTTEQTVLEPWLREGDLVALVSPSGPAKQSDIDYAVDSLESWGLRVAVGEHALDTHDNGYLAGGDEERRTDLISAWSDPEVVAVMAARGGFGAMRLLDGIDFDSLPRETSAGRAKLLTGSSDITALHQAWQTHLGVPTLFSPMPGNAVFRDSEAIREDVRRWLFEPWAGRIISGALSGAGRETGAQTLFPGTARGMLTGGNLSLLAASVGASEYRLPKAAIALLEDVDEEPYRLDNLLLQLDRTGWLDAASALVMGSWEGCGDPERVKAAVTGYLDGRQVPMVWNMGFGHDPHAASVPLGVAATLQAEDSEHPSIRVDMPNDCP